MKTLLFFLSCLLLGLSQDVYAQADFAPKGATWYYDHVSTYYNGYRLQRSVGDTTVAGTMCRQIDLLRVDSDWAAVPNIDTVAICSYFVYANADTVFYYNESYERFVPLYIFNVQIGDTLRYYMPEAPPASIPDSSFRVVVTNITTTDEYGTPIRTVFSQGLDPDYSFGYTGYTERLGYIDGLDWNLWAHISDYTAIELRCYTDDKIQYVRDAGIACNPFDQILSVDGVKASPGISIYPNPATDQLTVQVASGGRINNLRLCDALGRVVYQMENPSGSSMQVNTRGLIPGMYLLRLESDAGRIVKKINIQ
ncbi:MAG: T9SS type A sorting domain-containing protein [Sphingobacteriales bacterium]|nr:MAG: T9SS type A sorting domain-containing protein [Sphingobacteriales bacterium]